MDKFCKDCVHNEVCRYDAICITGHCNDKETLDDLRPKGQWSDLSDVGMHTGWIACTVCGCEDKLEIEADYKGD